MPDVVRARFEDIHALETALRALKDSRFDQYEAFGPTNLKELEDLMPASSSFVRGWTTTGAIIGLCSFWFMCVAAALIFNLITGGKPPWSNVPFVIPAYEGTILFGAITAMVATISYARLGIRKPPEEHDPRFTSDRYGIEVGCEEESRGEVERLLRAAKGEVEE